MRRYATHRRHLREGRHGNPRLQAAYDKHGPDAGWEFSLIEECARSELTVREQYWLDALDAFEHGFNCGPAADNAMRGIKRVSPRKGAVLSQETRNKISQSLRRQIQSEETRAKRSRSLKGRTFSDETLLKMSESAMGRRHTQETREKMSESAKKRQRQPPSEETRRKISESNKLTTQRKREQWDSNSISA